MDNILTKVYDKCGFEMTNFILEPESTDYDACQFQLNGLSIISRNGMLLKINKHKKRNNGSWIIFMDSF